MDIAVIDEEGRTLAVYPITVGGSLTVEDAFNLAKEAVIEDGTVDEESANGLSFAVVGESPNE